MNVFEAVFDAKRDVLRGAAILDRKIPDWEFRVKPEDITTIHSGSGCVLKKLFGDFSAGMIVLDQFGQGSCGFFCPVEMDAEYVAAWRELIAKRREASAPDTITPQKMGILQAVLSLLGVA